MNDDLTRAKTLKNPVAAIKQTEQEEWSSGVGSDPHRVSRWHTLRKVKYSIGKPRNPLEGIGTRAQ